MSRHLIKMLVGLVGMGIFGLICLFIINLYQKQGTSQAQIPVTPTASSAHVK